MKLSAAFEASIALSFGDVSDAYQFFPSTLGISDNPDYRANLQHCRITDIDYKRNHAGVSDHVPSEGPMGRRATAKEVAQAAGVSKWTVIRAFTPGASITEETRAKVLKVAQKLNYSPNLLARSLATNLTNQVAVGRGQKPRQSFICNRYRC